MIEKFGVLVLQSARYGRVLTLALLRLFHRDGDRRAAHSLRDAILQGKVSVKPALFLA